MDAGVAKGCCLNTACVNAVAFGAGCVWYGGYDKTLTRVELDGEALVRSLARLQNIPYAF